MSGLQSTIASRATAARTSAPLRIRLDRAMTVRSLAIIGVVCFHAYSGPYGAPAAFAQTLAPLLNGGLAEVWQTLAGGVPGPERLVAIFFIVAGYFAHRAYQRSCCTQGGRARRAFVRFFLWRRFWRLVPAFWVALLFSYFVSFDHPFTWDGLRKLVVNASLFKTLYPGYFYSINYAHWYVAAQWQLDLLYPIFLYMLARRSAAFAVAVAWGAAIFFTFVVPHFSEAAWLHYFPARWWAEWSLGAFLAMRHLAGGRVFSRPHTTMLAAAAGLVVGQWQGWGLLEWVALRVLLAAVFECLLLSRSPRRNWERRIAPIGACGYSLYLLHIPVQQLVARGLRSMGFEFGAVPVWIVFAAISFVLALIIARWSAEQIEARSAALGNRLWRRRWLIRFWLRRPRGRLLEPLAWVKKSRSAVAPLALPGGMAGAEGER